jgi:predicted AAA+ superfamily ATPase
MLAGRAFVYNLFPLSFIEIGKEFDLIQSLKWGTLPRLFSLNTDEERMDFLRSYSHTYITQEINEEQVIRRLDPFRRFLYVAAQMSGKIINFSKIAREVGTNTPSVISYFQILEDTLLGFLLESYHTSIRKSQRENPKFYFFDTGILRSLNNTLTLDVLQQTYIFGDLFEHFIINEIYRLNSYLKKDYRFYYLRTKSGLEIDLIIERPGLKTILLEIKSTDNVVEENVKSLITLSKDIKNSESYCLSLDKISKKFGNVLCLNWQEGVKRIISL